MVIETKSDDYSDHYVIPESQYDKFMAREGVPIYRSLGVRDVRELELGDWARLGGRGAYLQPIGTEGLWGLFVLEVSGRGALEPERHIYEEFFLVVEGYGTTEVWSDTGGKATFEWQPGSLFNIPLNTKHRILNVSSGRALMIATTLAPPVINLYGCGEFVFNNSVDFVGEYGGELTNYFQYNEEISREPMRGLPSLSSNFVPDVVNSQLPRDPSGRRRHHVDLHLGSGKQHIFLAEAELGKYVKAHYHKSGPVLVCLRGQGYTLTWPRSLGTTPWADGHGSEVLRQDYVPGGLVAAAPGGGDWFHQHFGVGVEPMRQLMIGAYGLLDESFIRCAAPGSVFTKPHVNIADGGNNIDYADEDPYIRDEFDRQMVEVGRKTVLQAGTG